MPTVPAVVRSQLNSSKDWRKIRHNQFHVGWFSKHMAVEFGRGGQIDRACSGEAVRILSNPDPWNLP
jgi:hypothetical protein